MEVEKPDTITNQAEHANVAFVEDDPGVVTLKTWIVVLILSIGYGLSFWPIPCEFHLAKPWSLKAELQPSVRCYPKPSRIGNGNAYQIHLVDPVLVLGYHRLIPHLVRSDA